MRTTGSRESIAPSTWQTGLVLGATAAALSLRPSGLQRGAVAQPLLALASFGLGFGAGVGLEKGIRAVGDALDVDHDMVRAAALGVGLVGMTVMHLPNGRAIPYAYTMNSTGKVLMAGAGAGLAATAHNYVADKLHSKLDGPSHWAVTTGMLGAEAAALVGYLLYRRGVNARIDPTTPGIKATLAAIGTVAGAATLAGTEQLVAEHYKEKVGGSKWPTHIASALGVAALVGGGLFLAKTIHARKLAAAVPGLTTELTTVAGTTGSLVDATKLGSGALTYLNTTLSAAEITRVTGAPAIDPIRVAVGMKSAASPAERAELALKELDRLGAWSRKHLFVTVPPGAGKIDPPLVASAEYMTGGDIASVVLQYSDRPSALSLTRVDDGAATYEAFFKGLEARLGHLPVGQRPEIIGYGNSLGAWTLQETARGKGVAGLHMLDRALFVGTPGPSGWYRQMLFSSDPKFATDRTQVLQYSTVEELQQFMATPEAATKRFFLHTRASDPVPRIDFDMLWRKPVWLRGDFRHVSGTAKHAVYTPGVSFLQELTDVVVGAGIADNPKMARLGHTYHTDIVTDVRHALLPGKVSDKVEAAVHSVLDGAAPINH